MDAFEMYPLKLLQVLSIELFYFANTFLPRQLGKKLRVSGVLDLLLFIKIFPQHATFKPLAIRSPELIDTVPDITFISSQWGIQQGSVCLLPHGGPNVNFQEKWIRFLFLTHKKENAISKLLCRITSNLFGSGCHMWYFVSDLCMWSVG